MSNNPNTVAPSLEIVVSLEVVIILSMPRGPKVNPFLPNVVFTTSTIAYIALMLEIICPVPSIVSVPSLRRRIVGC